MAVVRDDKLVRDLVSHSSAGAVAAQHNQTSSTMRRARCSPADQLLHSLYVDPAAALPVCQELDPGGDTCIGLRECILDSDLTALSFQWKAHTPAASPRRTDCRRPLRPRFRANQGASRCSLVSQQRRADARNLLRCACASFGGPEDRGAGREEEVCGRALVKTRFRPRTGGSAVRRGWSGITPL